MNAEMDVTAGRSARSRGETQLCQDRPNQLGAILVGLGVVVAAATVVLGGARLPVAQPLVLVPAALALLWPHDRPTGCHQVQGLILLYLVFLIISVAADVHWEILYREQAERSLRVSGAWPCLLLLAAGRLAQRRRGARVPFSVFPGDTPLFVAIGVLALHAVALTLLLWWHYGYGWEYEIQMFGRVGLCVVVAVLIVPLAHSPWPRAIVGILAALWLVWMA
ncbi:MAG TPA: hypothetical protein VMZ31_05145 [Phycisphaerae bacterium]|nr:hypothetical protein [Phycisphaerae bacterium]